MSKTYTNLSSSSIVYMNRTDRNQFRDYCRRVTKIESESYKAERAVEMAREDAEINDLNHHLNTLCLECR